MKYQWHKIAWRLSPERLKEAILNEPYSENLGRGFKLDSFIAGKLIGRYIVKKTYTEEIVTPLGNQEQLDRVQYVMYEFDIEIDKQLSLTLKNPPRSIAELGSALARITNHQVTFFPLKVNLRNGVQLLSDILEKVTITRVNLGNVPFQDGSVGTISLRGSGDLLNLISNHPEVSQGLVTKLDFSFDLENMQRKASLTNQGTLTCDDSISETIKPIIHNVLTSLISHN